MQNQQKFAIQVPTYASQRHTKNANSLHIDFGDLYVLVVGLLTPVEIHLTGTLLLGDILFLLSAIYLIPKQGQKLLQTQRSIQFILLGVWLLSQIITDVIRLSDSQDYLRGWARIVTFSINLAACYMLLKTNRRIIIYLLGLSVSLIAKYYYQPMEAYQFDPWKWAFGWPITVIFVCVATVYYKPGKSLVTTLCLLAACSLNFYFNFRSMALFCFGTACCVLLSGRKPRRPDFLKIFIVGSALGLALWMFSGLYVYIVSNGYLGLKAEQKFDDQSAGDGTILLASRNESLSSLQAIMDSPIIGHGSWAKDPQYSELLRSSLAQRGYKTQSTREDTIPTHSHIAGAWVEAGIGGIFFWILVLIITGKGLVSFLSLPMALRPLGYFCAISLLWDIPFSPFGGDRPVITPIFVLVMANAANFRLRRRRGGQSQAFGFTDSAKSEMVRDVQW
jgi:hypothetical protein